MSKLLLLTGLGVIVAFIGGLVLRLQQEGYGIEDIVPSFRVFLMFFVLIVGMVVLGIYFRLTRGEEE